MSIYSFGEDSPLKIELNDEDAESYNKVRKAINDRRAKNIETFGTMWRTGIQEKFENLDQKDIEVFLGFLIIYDRAVMLHGSPIYQKDLKSDYLVKN